MTRDRRYKVLTCAPEVVLGIPELPAPAFHTERDPEV